MKLDPQDRILNTLIEEVLDEVQAPDLTSQILARLGGGSVRSAESVSGNGSPHATVFEPAAPPLPSTPDPLAPPLPSEPRGESAPVPAIRARQRRSKSRASRWSYVAAAASVVLLLGGLAWWQNHASLNHVVVNPKDDPDESGNPIAVPPSRVPTQDLATKDRNSNQGTDQGEPDASASEIGLAPFDEPLFPTEELFSASSPELKEDRPETPAPSASLTLSDELVVQATNRILADSWREAGVTAAPATDEQWCRRLYLQMLGRIPTVSELQAFVDDQREDRRDQLVRQLQHGEDYAEEYAAHWASFWGTVLVGRRGGMEDDDSSSREHLEQYLRDSLKKSKPYDVMVRELIAAEGSGRPGSPDYNPAANFLLASMDDGGDKQALLATSRTFQVFHGQQVRCIQCHPHPTNGWSQQEFWSLNAFFRQMKVKRGPAGPSLVDADFRGEGPGGIEKAEVFFEQLNGETVAALPEYRGESVNASGRLSDVRRRELLADFVASDLKLAQAAVNRLWGHFHGFGFTRPVDDMGPHNPVSHPELLELLSEQFANNGYELDRLVRWIASADSFSRTSQVSQTASVDSPESGRPLFSRYYTRQLQPEAVYDSLRMVADMGPRDTNLEGRSQWLGQFIQPMGTDEGQELSTYEGDVRQSLIIMNGPLMRKATNSDNSDGLLHRVVKSKMSFDKKVEHLFMAAVARKPTRRELNAIGQLQSKRPDASDALESIWWALLNSNEFILDH